MVEPLLCLRLRLPVAVALEAGEIRLEDQLPVMVLVFLVVQARPTAVAVVEGQAR